MVVDRPCGTALLLRMKRALWVFYAGFEFQTLYFKIQFLAVWILENDMCIIIGVPANRITARQKS